MIAGFERRATVYESAALEITRSVRTADGMAVVIKAIKHGADSPQLRSRLKREHELLQTLARENVTGILRPLYFSEKPELCCLISMDSGGTSLRQIMTTAPLSLREALDVGVQLCNTLMDLHANQVIHKHINPHNVVFNRRTAHVELIDFTAATQMARELQPLDSLQTLQSTLAFVSPEQTGRLNRWLDYRTDIYSLGATLYSLVTGRPPFESSDLTQLVYAVLAKMPAPAHSLVPQLPAMVSSLIARLMEKMPEQRYQSAQGVRADLLECQEQLTRGDRIEAFVLGRGDRSNSLEIPQRLYGRTTELATLNKLLVPVPPGAAEFIVVHGVSGTGKTALLLEALRDLPTEVQFASAKHDPSTRHVPFSAISHAFSDLLAALRKKPDAVQRPMRTRIVHALGRAGRALLPILPALEHWVTDLPALPELTPLESENRLLLLWHRLLIALADERPVVLMLDDLQWADAATLKVLKYIAIDERPRAGVRVIGAYRDNEVTQAHPLTRLLETLSSSLTPLHALHVGPLQVAHVQELLMDATRANAATCLPLAEFIYDKTAGNPFFVREYIRHLWRSNLIAPHGEDNVWRWDLRTIAVASIPDNAVALMMSRLAALPSEEHALLSWAACLGNMFRLTDLCAAVGLTREHALHLLRGPEEANLVHTTTQPPDEVVYKFAHDRIQQAAYEMLSPRESMAAHYTMGRVLQMRLEEGETTGVSVFAVVGHLNAARDMILDPRERVELTQLNLAAAREARNGAAHGNALSYLHQALQTLPPDAWRAHYALRRDINLEQIVAEFMLGDMPAAHAHIRDGLQHAADANDRAELLRQNVICNSDSAHYANALETGIRALRELGVVMPLNPSPMQVRLAFVRTPLGPGRARHHHPARHAGNDRRAHPAHPARNLHHVFPGLLQQHAAHGDAHAHHRASHFETWHLDLCRHGLWRHGGRVRKHGSFGQEPALLRGRAGGLAQASRVAAAGAVPLHLQRLCRVCAHPPPTSSCSLATACSPGLLERGDPLYAGICLARQPAPAGRSRPPRRACKKSANTKPFSKYVARRSCAAGCVPPRACAAPWPAKQASTATPQSTRKTFAPAPRGPAARCITFPPRWRIWCATKSTWRARPPWPRRSMASLSAALFKRRCTTALWLPWRCCATAKLSNCDRWWTPR